MTPEWLRLLIAANAMKPANDIADVVWAEIERRVGEAFAEPDMDDFYEGQLLNALGAHHV